MILFFCGAPKNGSHFQKFILLESLLQKGLDFKKIGIRIFHLHKFREGKRLLDKLDKKKDKIFICKGHWGKRKERDLLLSYNNIRIFLIWRNIRDVLVSHYFYRLNKYGKDYTGFREYYLIEGRWFLLDQLKFRKNWQSVRNDSRVINASFARLVKNFHQATKEMVEAVGINGVDYDDLKKRVSLSNLRQKYNSNKALFRRGILDEHRQIINDQKIQNEIEQIKNLDYLSLSFYTIFEWFRRKYYIRQIRFKKLIGNLV